MASSAWTTAMTGIADLTFDAGIWRDGALLLPDDTVVQHTFRHAELAKIVGRGDVQGDVLSDVVVVSDGGGDDDDGCFETRGRGDAVSASEIAAYTSGRRGRNVSGFSIYWQSHGELIYALSGVTHCFKMYVECGKRTDKGNVVFATPALYLIRSFRGVSLGAADIVWPERQKAVWSRLVRIGVCVDRNRSEDTYGPFQGYRDGGQRSVAPSFASASAMREMTVAGVDASGFLKATGTPAFVHRVSVTYNVLNLDLPGTPGLVLDRCRELAGTKRVRLSQDGGVQNMFLCHVCLYTMGERSVAEDMIGSLYRRDVPGDPTFDRHVAVWMNAHLLAMSLNTVYDMRRSLTCPEERFDLRSNNASIARYYFERYAGVTMAVIYYGMRVLDVFYETWSAADALRRLGFVQLVHRVSREDLVALLRL
uniref:GP88 n=1 Tax=Caviid herpesvirus 2 str. CIDMTR TaxID=1415526 RepID=U6H6S6_9BETA|nr:GP88 [Caviid herpesvirus 2 str. CIDMTR]